MINCVRVAWELDASIHAPRLFELLEPYRDQSTHDGVVPNLPVATCLGALASLLERYDEAEQYFAQASDIHGLGRGPCGKAEMELWWGQTLLRRGAAGDTERARELLEAARSTAARHGYARIERQAAEELAGVA